MRRDPAFILTQLKEHRSMTTMRAVQVVGYHQNLEMKVPVPEATGPFDVVVRIGGAGVCRTDLHILEGQWAGSVSRCPTRSGTRTRAGCTPSAAR